GRHEEAARLADDAREKAGNRLEDLVEIAAVYAMCVPEVGRGKEPDKLTPAEKALRQKYADTAIGMLRDMAHRGFSDWGYLQIEVDYDALRPYPEFQALIARLRKAGAK